MRIALISREYPPETMFGGIGSYTYYLAKGLVGIGHSVTVLTSFLYKHGTFLIDGINVIKIGPYNNKEQYKENIRDYFNGEGKNCYDIIESPDWGADGFLISKYVTRNTPHIVTCHTPSWLLYELFKAERTYSDSLKQLAHPKRWGIFRFSEEFQNVRRAASVHAPSHAMMNIVEKRLGPLKNKIVIPNPCYADNPIPWDHTRSKDGKSILFVGKVNVVKGADFLPDIISRINQAYPNAVFRIIGGDARPPSFSRSKTMKDHIRSRLKHLGARLQLFDNLPLEAVREEYKKADLFIAPSRWESWGNVVAEAMAAGCPVVGSCHGGIQELIDPPNFGLTADPFDPVAFSSAAIQLLTDNELRNTISRRAYDMVTSKLSAESIATRKAISYQNAISSNNT